jgi:DNA ligase-1
MLGKDYAPERITFPCICSPKLNGVRAMYFPPDSPFLRKGQTGGFYSRGGVKYETLGHIQPSNRFIQDGELYYHGWDQQRILAAIAPNRQEASHDTEKVKFHIFDIAHQGDAMWRKSVLGLLKAPGVEPLLHRVLHKPGQLEEFYYQCIRNNFEGTMILDAYSAYTSGRTDLLLKMKSHRFLIAKCAMYTYGEGKCKGMVGALVCKWNDKIFHVGTGFSDAERDPDYVNKTYIGQYLVIRHMSMSTLGIPIQPSFVRVADEQDMEFNLQAAPYFNAREEFV